MIKNKLLLNRLTSSCCGALTSGIIAWKLNNSYIDYVQILSLVGIILSFTFQWALIEVVEASKTTTVDAILNFLGKMQIIVPISIVLTISIRILLFGGGYSKQYVLAFVLVVNNILTESYNHVATKLGVVIYNIVVNLIKIACVITVLFLFRSWLDFLICLNIILIIVNVVSIFKLVGIGWGNILPISKINIKPGDLVTALSLFLSGVSTNLDKLLIEQVQTKENGGVLYIVSDNSTVVLGFFLGIIYWRWLNEYRKHTVKISLMVLWSNMFMVTLFLLDNKLISLIPLEFTINKDLQYVKIILIIAYSIPSVLKSFVVEPLLIANRVSYMVVISNATYITVFYFYQTFSPARDVFEMLRNRCVLSVMTQSMVILIILAIKRDLFKKIKI